MLEALGSQTNAQHHVVLAATGAPRLDPLTEGGVRGAIALGTGHRRLNKCAHNSDNGKDALHCLCIRDVRLNTNNSKNDTHTHTHTHTFFHRCQQLSFGSACAKKNKNRYKPLGPDHVLEESINDLQVVYATSY